MESINRLIKSQGFIRFATIVFFVILLYLLRDLINLILFTFIFSFLIGRLHVFLMTYLKKIMPINSNLVVVFLYLLIVALVVFLFYRYLPIVIRQVSQLTDQLMYYYKNPPNNPTFKYLFDKAKGFASPADLENRIKVVYSYITNIGKVSVQIFMALLLSLFFLLEKGSISQFTAKFRKSKIGPVFAEIEFFGRKFANTFGKVIEVQFLIAFVNAVLSTIFLAILGFPKLFGLGLMIFLLGLIPVAGVFISLIPLMTIAYSIGGGREMIYIIIMVVLIHALESYVLNPKLMSAKTNLPAFYTFIILIVSEHFLGIWGLIIGIPIFIFLLDILDVQDSEGSAHLHHRN